MPLSLFRLLPTRRSPHQILPLVLLGSGLLASQAQAGSVQFSSSTLDVNENAGTATLTIERSGDVSTPATVGVVFTHGTATSSDFALSTQSVSWAAGDATPKTIEVTLTTDGVEEGSETAHFTLNNVVGDTLGGTTETTLRILESSTGIATNLQAPTRFMLTALTEICGNETSAALAEGCALYNELSAAEKQHSANTMLPRQVAAQVTNIAQAQHSANQAVQQRMQNLREGGGDNSLSGLHLMMDGELVSAQSLVNEWHRQNVDEPVGGNAGDGLLDDRYGVFVSGQLQIADKDSSFNELGYEAKSQQITAGLDYRASTQLFFGGAISYSTSNTDYNDDFGKQDADVVIFNLFGNYYITDHWYADGLINYGQSSFDNERIIDLGSRRFTADSDTDGSQWGIAVTGGYDKSVREWQFGGYGRVEFNKFDIDGYEESGGGGFALAIDKRDAESKQTAFGGSVSYVKSVRYGIWVPKLSAEWVHEFEDKQRQLKARFVNAPSAGTLTLPTATPDSDFFNVGWSIAGTFTQGRSAWLRYEAQLGRDDYIAELVELGARIPF